MWKGKVDAHSSCSRKPDDGSMGLLEGTGVGTEDIASGKVLEGDEAGVAKLSLPGDKPGPACCPSVFVILNQQFTNTTPSILRSAPGSFSCLTQRRCACARSSHSTTHNMHTTFHVP